MIRLCSQRTSTCRQALQYIGKQVADQTLNRGTLYGIYWTPLYKHAKVLLPCYTASAPRSSVSKPKPSVRIPMATVVQPCCPNFTQLTQKYSACTATYLPVADFRTRMGSVSWSSLLIPDMSSNLRRASTAWTSFLTDFGNPRSRTETAACY